MIEYERMAWLRIACATLDWPPRAQRELGAYLVAHEDVFIAEIGRVLESYRRCTPRPRPQCPERRA